MIEAIVLAAGSSVRMGSVNKLTMRFGSQTVVSAVIDQLSQAKIDKINVVLGHQHKQVISALDSYKDLDFVYNSIHKNGQMSSIQTAMGQVRDESNGFMICLGDMPSITSADYNHIIDSYYEAKTKIKAPIVRPEYRGSIGHPVIFDTSYKSIIATQKHNSRCKSVIDSYRSNYVGITVSSVNYFLDIDNEEDYNRLIQYASTKE